MSFQIKNFTVSSENKILLKNLNLEIKSGEIVAIMGPNGSGKSTLAQTLAGNPVYKIESGEVIWQKKDKKIDVLKLSAEQRSGAGMFVSFQNPPIIEGLKVATFLKEMKLTQAKNQNLPKPKISEILKNIKSNLELVNLDQSFYSRVFNQDFSGGEKRKNELLQLLMLDPDFILLDEIDSGLDLNAINKFFSLLKEKMTKKNYLIIITHNPNIFEIIKPDKIIILKNGEFKTKAGSEILPQIQSSGFNEF